MATMHLIHGSSKAHIDGITETGIFGGIFTLDYNPGCVNHGYGEHLHIVSLDDSEICRHGDITERLSRERIDEVIAGEIDLDALDEYDIDENERAEVLNMLRRWALETDDANSIEIYFGGDDCEYGGIFEEILVGAQAFDAGSLGFEIQRIRGLLARAAGFRAVDCYDENGISTLVIGGIGTKIMPLEEFEKASV